MTLLLLLGCTGGDAEPPLLDDYGAVPAFSLLDQSGATVTPARLAGKVWVADFIFTRCPDICPALTAHMREVTTRYAGNDQLRFVSFSVDPDHDTPPVLLEYAGRFGADLGRWSFLTGPLDEVRAVVVDGFKQSMEKVPNAKPEDPATILHGSRFVVVDRAGRMRAFPDPYEPEKKTLYAAIDAVLAEP